METATIAQLHMRAYQEWQEIVELDLHNSEDIVYGIMPLLSEALSRDPDHLPSLDLMSDMLLEINAWEEAFEFMEKMFSLAQDDPDYRPKLALLNSDPQTRRHAIRAYLHRKRLQLNRNPA